MWPVTLYTTDQCARCVTAKALLARRGVGYEEINLAKDPDGRTELARRTGMVTFPQIVIAGETLGGLDELVAADREGRLKLLAALEPKARQQPISPQACDDSPSAWPETARLRT
jgi:glutaredoxin 3